MSERLTYHLLRTFNRVALPPVRWLTAVLRKYNERRDRIAREQFEAYWDSLPTEEQAELERLTQAIRDGSQAMGGRVENVNWWGE